MKPKIDMTMKQERRESDGSGMGKTVSSLKPSAPDTLIETSRMLNGADSKALFVFAKRYPG